MNPIVEIVVSLLIVIGAAFILVGSYGLIRLPNLVSRLHAPTKSTTLGVGGTLVASMVYFAVHEGSFSVHELLITLFLFLTAPITAHFIAKAFLHRHLDIAGELPARRGTGWSTFGRVRGRRQDDVSATPGGREAALPQIQPDPRDEAATKDR